MTIIKLGYSSSVKYKINYDYRKGLKLQEKVKKKRTARGIYSRPADKIKPGFNHRGKPSGRKYSIIPARAVTMSELSPNDLLLLATFGLFTSRQGVTHPTIETITNLSGLGATQVIASTRRLVNAGLVRKLLPKWYPGQQSNWPTNRYQVLYLPDDPIPTEDELIASIPFATDSDETYTQVEHKPTEIDLKSKQETEGIERDIKAIAQSYGHIITTDSASLTRLANLNPTREAIAHGFRLYLTRFGSLPPSLAVLLDRGTIT